MPNSCMPMTAKMKMMIQRTKVRFPRAPMVFPIMEMRRLSVGQDLANLNTLSWGRVRVIRVVGVEVVRMLVVIMVVIIVTLVKRMTLSLGLWAS